MHVRHDWLLGIRLEHKKVSTLCGMKVVWKNASIPNPDQAVQWCVPCCRLANSQAAALLDELNGFEDWQSRLWYWQKDKCAFLEEVRRVTDPISRAYLERQRRLRAARSNRP